MENTPITPKENKNNLDKGYSLLALLQIINIVLYSQFTQYGQDLLGTGSNTQSNTITTYYPFFKDVHVMIFVGFGFLMTYLNKYSFSSIGFNFLLACLSLQYSILINGFFHNLFENHWNNITLDIQSLITGDFAAGTILISFGALLGKVDGLALITMTILELIFYAINESIGVIKYKAVDMGGSMYVHTFGAFFGLAVSYITHNKDKFKNSKLVSTKNSDLFAMIGTLFLWIYWPSFNGALASGNSQHRVVINTVLALSNSCIFAFISSKLLRKEKKFSMVDIQNATLSGGVAVGSSADLVIGPYASLIVGAVAGTWSVIGYIYLTPILENKFKIYDTCGVLNLHGMPGIIGGLGGFISAATASSTLYGENLGIIFEGIQDGRSNIDQGLYQLAALGTTLGISIGGGLLTGLIVKKVNTTGEYAEDEENWHEV